jgi:GGDEF domain-containing protein
MPFRHLTQSDIVINSIGASFGFACYPDQGEQLSELLHVADQQMYLQKATTG